MKPVTITMPEDLDERAASEAKRRGISKSELIRLGLQSVLPRIESKVERVDDLWTSLAGFGSETVTMRPGEIDEIVYGA